MTRRVLVTDAGRTSAIACIRALGRRGWHVIAGDSDPHSTGFRSRFTKETFVYPAPEKSPRAFLDALHGFLATHAVDLLLPVTDECIHPLATERARFEPLTRLAIPPAAALARVTDKRATLELARELGLAVPETRVVQTVAEALRAAAELRYPLVLKPAVSRRYLPEEDRIEVGHVSFAHDARELALRMAGLEGGAPVILQSYEEGVGVGVECLAQEGRVLRAFQHRRLAEIPVHGGASAWRESVPLDPVLLAQSTRLIEALGWTGLVMVEFKLGVRPWLLEVNGRVWGSIPLACLAGVDFPGELGELYCPEGAASPAQDGPPRVNGASMPPLGSYEVGLRSYNLEMMLSWIAQILLGHSQHPYLPRPGRRRALAGMIGLLDPSQKSDLAGGAGLALRVAEARHITRKFASKVSAFTRGR